MFPTTNDCRQSNSVVRPINELVSEFWLESRSDGMVDYVCFRLIGIAAQKCIGSRSEFGLAGTSSPTQYEYVTRFEVDGRLLNSGLLTAQMMVLQGSHQAKADTRLEGSHTWCIIDLQRRRL